MFTYIDPGPFYIRDTLVWDRVRREAQYMSLPDELLIVITLSAHELSRLSPVIMEAVGMEGFTTAGRRHPLVKDLLFDGQLRMGRIAVGDDGTVQVRPRIWSARNSDFRLDVDNVDGEGSGSAFGDSMKTYRLTAREMADLGLYEDEGGPEPERMAPTAWAHLLEDDGL